MSMMFGLSKIKVKGSPLLFHTNEFYHLKGGDTFEKYQSFDKSKKHDVLFVGSSRAYRGYDPELFNKEGLVAWNLGTSAQTIRNSRIIIEHYVNSDNCKLLVLDLYPGAFNTLGLESSSDLIENVSETDAAVDVAISMEDSRALNLLTARWMTQGLPSTYMTDDYKGLGFSTKTDTMALKKENLENDTTSFKVNEEQLQEFDLLLDFCKKENINLLLVVSPTSDYYSPSIHKSFLERINPFIEKYQFTLWDYAKELEVKTPDHFYDDSHMNYPGVEMFNARFISDLLDSKFKTVLSND